MNEKNPSIAIHAPAQSGKSTEATLVAKNLGFVYVDTGAMYRTVGLYCAENSIDLENMDEVKKAFDQVRIVSLDKEGASSTVHWRIGEAPGRQDVLEFENGKPCFYENQVGVLTNSPDFKWQVTNLNNYVNLFPGNAPVQKIGNVTIFPFGAGSGFLGIPGDITPPSRFVRIAFY